MSSDIEVVAAGPDDADIVGDLVYELLLELFPEHYSEFPRDKMKQTAAQLLLPDSGVWSFLAICNSEVVGIINLNECSAIYAGGKFGEITELYVKPGSRSASVGEYLISRACEFAREKAWPVLEVGAPDVPRCQRAVEFYIDRGFSEVGPRLELEI